MSKPQIIIDVEEVKDYFQTIEPQIEQSKAEAILAIDTKLNEATQDIQQQLASLFDFENWAGRSGHTYKTLFDTPTSGDITEEIRNTSSDALVASKVTEFDTPAAGQIQETLSIVEDAITVRKITTFNVDGSIDEAITEVI